MPIRADRLARDIAAIAAQPLSTGANRPTFSPAWVAARNYVIAQAQQFGCLVLIDPAGNVHIRQVSNGFRNQPVWLSGSHLDSVPNGGDFDGVLGVVAPLEVLRAAHEDGVKNLPLELVIFAEEEGTTFGLGMLGSRAWAGTLSVDQLGKVRNAQGENYLQAGERWGVRPNEITADGFRPSDYAGMIELHIEQGPAMWNRGQPVAVVSAINGRRQYRAEIRGVANHAGSTSMTDRRDALAGAAEMMTYLEGLMPTLSPRAVATVGQIQCWPSAVNVIPEKAVFAIDFRAPDNEVLARGDAQIRERFAALVARRGLSGSLDASEALPAVPLDPRICERLSQTANRLGHGTLPETTSGALHDAAILAPFLPTAMLFVASKDGISHNPAEFSRMEDIALATEILYEAVKTPFV
ncbi:MAG: Zn-dependent hydrolase [Pirellulaceae bacterium]|nr:Zn-dependent hydrolase [Pirellulaceae bacterium]